MKRMESEARTSRATLRNIIAANKRYYYEKYSDDFTKFRNMVAKHFVEL